MMTRQKAVIVLMILTSVLLPSCIIRDFSPDEKKWFNPFEKTDTVIFLSTNNELDTIIFHKTDTVKFSVRSIEQGFYNEIILSVSYEFTEGSYHQSAKMSDGIERYKHRFVSVSSYFESIEITFIGMIFNGVEIKNIEEISDNIYFFDSNKATYRQVGVERGIKSFTFDTTLGVIEYIDNRDVKWIRKCGSVKREILKN